MIIWLASYPKSGNTWVRAFINSLIYGSVKDNSLVNIDRIRSYPLTLDFKNLLDDYNNFGKIAENWIISQRIINLNKKNIFLKTHHVLCRVNNHSFTDYKNSLGAIHIVRDPRNVITSLKNYYSLNDYHEALKFITNNKKFIGKIGKKEEFIRATQFPTYVTDWKDHYNSWKNFKKNYLLIKYEDLIEKPQKNFIKISKFLSKLLDLDLSNKKINKAIEDSSFDKLEKIEKKFGFAGAPIDEETKKKQKFFYLGPKNNWKKLLDTKTVKKIENTFQKEMIELGYL